jgi:hypothetical protein
MVPMTYVRGFAGGVLLLSGALGSGCGTDVSNAGPPGDGGVSGDACGKYYDSLIARASACSFIIPGTTPYLGERADFLRRCQAIADAPGSAAYANYVLGCASAIDAQPAGCTTLKGNELPACQGPAGTLTTGAACGKGTQCASGSCALMTAQGTDGGASTNPARCGTCAPSLPAGADCSAGSSVCAGDLVCLAGKCGAKPQEGQSCISIRRDGSTEVACASGLLCDADPKAPMLTGTCKTPPTKGAACNSRCASGLTCVNAVCSEFLTEGEDCGGRPTACRYNLTCDAVTKKCRPYTVLSAGQACALPGALCGAGMSCVITAPSASACVPLLPDGAVCKNEFGNPMCKLGSLCIDAKCQLDDPGSCK